MSDNLYSHNLVDVGVGSFGLGAGLWMAGPPWGDSTLLCLTLPAESRPPVLSVPVSPSVRSSLAPPVCGLVSCLLGACFSPKVRYSFLPPPYTESFLSEALGDASAPSWSAWIATLVGPLASWYETLGRT